MKYLVVLKRFEIWLLLAVVGFVIFYAVRPVETRAPANSENPVVSVIVPEENRSIESDQQPVEVEKRIQVERVDVIPSGSGRIVEITFAARSHDGKTAVLNETTLKATTNSGAVVKPFFEPFRSVALIDPDESSIVSMKFWLEEDAKEIWLDFQGEKAKAALPD